FSVAADTKEESEWDKVQNAPSVHCRIARRCIICDLSSLDLHRADKLTALQANSRAVMSVVQSQHLPTRRRHSDKVVRGLCSPRHSYLHKQPRNTERPSNSSPEAALHEGRLLLCGCTRG